MAEPPGLQILQFPSIPESHARQPAAVTLNTPARSESQPIDASGENRTYTVRGNATATTADGDYMATSGRLTIPAKTGSATIPVLVDGDDLSEPAEVFLVELFNPSVATIANRQGKGTIENDDGLTAVVDPRPTEFALSPVSPNPSRWQARVEFTVPQKSRIQLSVVDLQGREVATLAEGTYPAGRHQQSWDLRLGSKPAPAGVYFLRYQTPAKTLFMRFVIVL